MGKCSHLFAVVFSLSLLCWEVRGWVGGGGGRRGHRKALLESSVSVADNVSDITFLLLMKMKSSLCLFLHNLHRNTIQRSQLTSHLTLALFRSYCPKQIISGEKVDRILPLRDFSEYFQIIEYDELLINNQQLPPDKTEFICSSGRFPEQSVDRFVPLRPCTSYISWQLCSNDCFLSTTITM